MGIILIGINHKTAPIKIREPFSFTHKKLKETLIELKQIDSLLGIIILSTCNRTEIYLHQKNTEMQKPNDDGRIVKLLIKKHWLRPYEFNRYFYLLKDLDAVRHIFRVSSGLDSQILGETQILGQVKSAWRDSQDLGTTSDILDRVFTKAVDIGRTARLKTKISYGNVSIASVAINMLEEKFNNLSEKSLLIIGAGKISTLISKYLKKKKAKGIFVSNRTYLKAKELALNCRGNAINFSQLNEKLKAVDIVISSTASPHLILKKKALEEIMQLRVNPLLIMDLSLPRDVDPLVKDVPGVSLYDLDDLKSVVEKNFAQRQKEAIVVEKIIQSELSRFLDNKMFA